ncbi:hypothetical protein FM125_11245 [Micrococcus lylae]|uniref:Uncharacterized protein n=1 Tax=Micrococcus lylae TaxID=1273 RepID=A0A1R4JXT7_9MICC|nr:hypothetical protein FM125_11245 [Micrococcus lylae]
MAVGHLGIFRGALPRGGPVCGFGGGSHRNMEPDSVRMCEPGSAGLTSSA